MKNLSLLFFFFGMQMLISQTLTYEKIFGVEADGRNEAFSIAMDSESNTYVSGVYFSNIKIGETEFTSDATFFPGYFFKLDKDYNLIWVYDFKSNFSETSSIGSIKIDDEDNIYLSGTITGQMDMDFGAEEFLINTNGSADPYVAKYSSTMDLIWVRNFGGQFYDASKEMEIDDNGNVYVAGSFTDAGDFDPGPEELIVVGDVGTNQFVSKFDNEGKLEWVYPITSKSTGGMEINSLKIKGDHVYVGGYFTHDISFPNNGDFIVREANNSRASFVIKLTEKGSSVWIKTFEGKGSNFSTEVCIDSKDNILMVGGFKDVVDFDPGPDTRTLVGMEFQTYILKLDQNGDFIYAFECNADWLPDAKIDAHDNLIICGYTRGEEFLFPVSEENPIGNPFATNSFVAILSPDVKVKTVSQQSSLGGLVYSSFLHINNDGLISLAGGYKTDLLVDELELRKKRSDGVFITQMEYSEMSTSAEFISLNELKIFPNPAEGFFSIDLEEVEEHIHVDIFDMLGKKVYSQKYKGIKDIRIHHQLTPGIYTLETRNHKGQIRSAKLKVIEE